MKWHVLALVGLASGALAACDQLPAGLPMFVTPPTTPAANTAGGAPEGAQAARTPEQAASNAGAASDTGAPAASGGVTNTARTGVPAARAPSTDATATGAVTGTLGAPAEEDGSASDAGASGDTAGAMPAARSRAPLSGDMLSLAEIAAAEQLALASESVRQVVASAVDRDAVMESADARGADAPEALAAMADRPSYRVVYTQRYPDKTAEGRAAEVAIYRYDTGQTVISKVDLASGEVEAIDVPYGFTIPITPEEIDEAATIARADAQVRTALTGAGLDPDKAVANALITVAVDPDAACAQHRCLRLFFSSLRQPVSKFSVVVDMVSLATVEVAPMPASYP